MARLRCSLSELVKVEHKNYIDRHKSFLIEPLNMVHGVVLDIVLDFWLLSRELHFDFTTDRLFTSDDNHSYDMQPYMYAEFADRVGYPWNLHLHHRYLLSICNEQRSPG